MEFETMSREELAAKMKIHRTTLYRRMKTLDPGFQEQVAGRFLFPNEVKYIIEQTAEKWESGSK